MTIRAKSTRIMICVCLCAALIGASFATFTESHAASMKVTSTAIKNGVIDDKYCWFEDNGDPKTLSVPLKIKNAPKGTKYYAIYMYDTTVEWDHWLAANYKNATVPAGASTGQSGKMVQGMNSWDKIGYGGPTPPDGTHTYVIKVYALKSKVGLKNGFSKAQFTKAIKGKVLATATIKGKCTAR